VVSVASGECVELAFGPLGLDRVGAFTLPDNVASRRVMAKAEFTYQCATSSAPASRTSSTGTRP
jgi:hypothetical protein